MSERVRNLTPHRVSVTGQDGTVLASWEPDGEVARIRDYWIEEVCGPQPGGVPARWLQGTSRSVLDAFRGKPCIPEPEEGTVLIVSRLTAMTVPDRDDVFFPGPEVRDGNGRIIGCTHLGYLHEVEAGRRARRAAESAAYDAAAARGAV